MPAACSGARTSSALTWSGTSRNLAQRARNLGVDANTAGSYTDLLLTWPSREQWAVEIKRSLTPKRECGFRHAFEDLKPERKWVVYPGTESYPLLADTQAVSLRGLCEIVRAS